MKIILLNCSFKTNIVQCNINKGINYYNVVPINTTQSVPLKVLIYYNGTNINNTTGSQKLLVLVLQHFMSRNEIENCQKLTPEEVY